MADSTDKASPSPPVAGIILAAGIGSRMGQTKQLLPFKGRPILAHAIEQGLAAGLCPLVLVLGHRADEIQTQLPRFPIKTVINKEFQSGMASSLRTGLENLTHRPDQRPRGALFLLGDQPFVTAETITRILAAARNASGKIIIPTFHARRGNPVYFDACFFDQLMQLSGDTGGREIIHRFPHFVNEIPISSSGICLDIDTPEDYDRLCQTPEENEAD